MTAVPPALLGRACNKCLKESHEFICPLLANADMRVDSLVDPGKERDWLLVTSSGYHPPQAAPSSPIGSGETMASPPNSRRADEAASGRPEPAYSLLTDRDRLIAQARRP